ncbi:MAG: tetratricopeptide repeat protein [Acidobacteriota bacterium]|nr:tetratricopeptide repeat protein [Acidobacteriota bacterium]
MTGFVLGAPASGRHRSPGASETLTFRRNALAGIALALFVFGVAATNQPAADVRARMERAIALLAAEEVDRAIPILLSVVDEVPFHGPARFQLGALAVERGEWDVASDHLGAATRSYGPDSPEGAIPVQRPGLAWALYADALGQTGRLEDALEATARSLRIAPTYLPVLLVRSNVARRLAASEGADPVTGSRETLLETSLDAARKATEQAPDRPAPWTALALAADEAGIPQRAQCAARVAADLAPDDPRALFLVAWSSVATAPEESLAAAERALAAGLRDEPSLWMTLGRLRAFRLDMEGSLDAYREALRLDPASTGEMASVALDAIVAGGDPELRTLLETRAAHRPDALNTRFALAKAALREGEVERAAGELIRLAETAPDHAAILTSLHAALRRAGDAPAAEAVLVRLEEVKAAEAEAWERANATESRRRQAREAASRGDLEAAVRLWEEVLSGREAPGIGATAELADDLSELGRALVALGRHGAALAVLRRSLALRPFDSETLSGAGQAARTVGENEAADLYAARALLTKPDCR